jgi:hypothetical protein
MLHGHNHWFSEPGYHNILYSFKEQVNQQQREYDKLKYICMNYGTNYKIKLQLQLQLPHKKCWAIENKSSKNALAFSMENTKIFGKKIFCYLLQRNFSPEYYINI